jgi:hypothetical protein
MRLQDMQFSGWKKWVLGIALTIILGALGSGLWELALRPFSQWAGKAVLTAATLGSSAVKDRTYREAAKGFHEAGALETLTLLNFWMLIACSGVAGYASARMRDSEASRELPMELKSKEQLEAKRASLEASIASLRKKLRISLRVMFGFLLLFVGNLGVESLEIIQANNAYTFFAQSMAICRPYMSDQQARLLESRFSAIAGRADYIGVIDDLAHIAASNQRRLPDFKPW